MSERCNHARITPVISFHIPRIGVPRIRLGFLGSLRTVAQVAALDRSRYLLSEKEVSAQREEAETQSERDRENRSCLCRQL
jgi:hypothetical protein